MVTCELAVLCLPSSKFSFPSVCVVWVYVYVCGVCVVCVYVCGVCVCAHEEYLAQCSEQDQVPKI